MPDAHFKDFKGMSPRVRGASEFAQTADNVDLYGGTIRPYPEDIVIDSPKRPGRFVRVDGVIHFFPDAEELKYLTFKGFHVVLYRNAGSTKWMRKTFESTVGTSIVTPLSFKPPVFSGQEMVEAGSQEDSSISMLHSFVYEEYKAGESTLQEGEYQYYAEIFDPVDGKPVAITKTCSQMIEYKRALSSDSGINAALIASGYELGDPIKVARAFGESTLSILTGFTYEGAKTGIAAGVNLPYNASLDGVDYVFENRSFKTYEGGSAFGTEVKYPDLVINENTGIVSDYDSDRYDKLNIGFDEYVGPDERAVSKKVFSSREGWDNELTPPVMNAIFADSGASGYVRLEGPIKVGSESGYRYRGLPTHYVPGLENFSYFPVTPSDVDWPYRDYLYIRRSDFEGSDRIAISSKVSVELKDFIQQGKMVSGKEYEVRLYRRGPFDNGFGIFRRRTKVAYDDNTGQLRNQDGFGATSVTFFDKNDGLTNLTPDVADSTSATIQRRYTYFLTYERLAGVGDKLEDWFEESGPSDQFSYDGFGPAELIRRPEISDVGAEVKFWNVYRLTEGEDGTNEFLLAGSLPITQEEFTDDVADTDLGEAPGSAFLSDAVPYVYEEMPSGLEHLSTFYNGMILGWRGGSLYWTDQYYMSGWTSTFNVELPHKIVNAVPMGSALIIVTTHGVYRAIATNPFDFSFMESPSGEGGKVDAYGNVFPRTVCPSDKGVLFVSDSGINLFDGTRATSLTDGMVGEEYFRGLDFTNAELIENDGLIHLFHGGDEIIVFDLRAQGSMSTVAGVPSKQIFRDHQSGSLLYLSTDNRIKELFAKPGQGRPMTYRTGEIHFGANFRKRVKYVQFLGAGTIQCKPFINGKAVGEKAKIINMSGMEQQTRIYLPHNATVDALELEITGYGEVEEFRVNWERL